MQKYDAVVGDVTIRANRSLYVDFTLPFTESGVSMVVHQGRAPEERVDLREAVDAEPLARERRRLRPGWWSGFWSTGSTPTSTPGGRRTRSAPSSTSPSHARLRPPELLSNLARVVVAIWLFVVLVLQSSYTASLTSMLTVQQLQPTVSDVDQLVRDGSKEYHDALLNGSVAAIVDEIPYLKVFLSKYCGKFAMVGTIDKSSGLGFAFPGSPLVPDVSTAILKVTESNKMKDLENMLYGNTSCADKDPHGFKQTYI
ncbi:hypothetical protein MUK42_04415 [Musa troglodytarum]|uniref:Ionotropic glutamate receptor C-terminal domain-containing protein n=1 Tax=Musa troglodytarum TaxID=320322 RepID=A0A9E7G3H6_9LILI|nr:hypothetical protein MUK42_04415 [Musa troglodytarum]